MRKGGKSDITRRERTGKMGRRTGNLQIDVLTSAKKKRGEARGGAHDRLCGNNEKKKRGAQV